MNRPFIGKQIRVTDRGEEVGLAGLFDALGWFGAVEDMFDLRDAQDAMAEMTELGGVDWKQLMEEPPETDRAHTPQNYEKAP